MSGPVYSRRLVPTTACTGLTAVNLGTVPAGRTWVVKSLILYNGSGTNTPTLFLRFRAPSSPALVSVSYVMGVTQTRIEELMMPLAAGDVIECQVGGTGTIAVTMGGFDFLN